MATKVGDADLYIQIPVWVKEKLFSIAEREGVPMSVLASCIILHAALHDELEMPPPVPVAPVPGVAEVLKKYVDGNTKLIGPCGKHWPCEQSHTESNWIGDVEFCGHCNIRIN